MIDKFPSISKWIAQQFTYVSGVAILWTLLYAINDYFFNFSLFNHTANLIFLPAMLRPLAVLLFGPAGVVGLFVGSLIGFNLSQDLPLTMLPASLASATAGLIAITALRQLPALAPQLTGELTQIKLSTIILLCTLTAACNALSHQIIYAFTGAAATPPSQLLAMFIGDTLGSLLMLYALAALLRFIRRAVEDK